MSIFTSDLFTGKTKVEIALARLKQFEPSEGYYLAFSGGKDSVVLLALAKMSGVLFDTHFNITTVDPPELLRFIKKEYPEVSRDRPDTNMWDLIIAKRFPPTRFARYCCEHLKERGGSGRIVLTGVRWEESYKRRKRRMVEICYKDTTKSFVHPIIDWSSSHIWEFINAYNITYCSLYDDGFTRIGCILCPYSSNREGEAARWPGIANKYIKTFNKLVRMREDEGNPFTWADGQEMFDWWIGKIPGEKKHTIESRQVVLF